MQNERENTICRLCLKSFECTLKNDEASTTAMLGFLGLELDLNLTGNPLMCKACSENLRKCFHFKTNCLYNEYCINSFKNDKNNVKLDLRDIYLKRKENENIPTFLAVSKCHSVCRLCMEIAQLDCYIALNDETKDVISAKTILGRCFPELDLDVTNDPVICTTCNATLHNYYSFIKYCLQIKDEKKKYCDVEENKDKPRQESNNVVKFAAENVSNCKNGYTGIDISKNYKKNSLSNEIKLEPAENLMQKESQELHIKREVNEHDVEVENLNSVAQCTRNLLYPKNDCTDMNTAKKWCDNEQNGKIEIKREHFVKTEGHEVYIKCEDINIKNENGDIARCQDNMQIAKDASGVATCQCKTFNNSVEMEFPHSFDVMKNKDEVEHNPWGPVADDHNEQEPEDGSAIWRPFDTDKKEHYNVYNSDSDNNSGIKVECDSKSVINRKHLPTVAQEMILNIYEKLESEKGSKYGIIKRISELTKVSHSTVKRIVSRKCAIKRKRSERGQLKKVTTSTRDEIKNLISDFYKSGKVPTIDDIFTAIREKQLHFPYKSRSTLWRLLSDMGFKFRKINGQHIMESH